MKNLLLLILALSALVLIAQANADDDKVTSVPGWPSPLPFPVYAGYLDIPNSNNRSLYYIMTQSQRDPDNDPVILWLNGGPGCSSLMGMATEIGPFVFEDGQTQFTLNPHSWNQRATLIFLESPAGVGFSQANVTETSYSDVFTTGDQFFALTVFFSRFPKLAKNPFYIAGESYAGIYIPNLAAGIDANNREVGPSDPTYINLKGIMVGNGVTNRSSLSLNSLEFYLRQDLIPESHYNMIKKYCHTAPISAPACQFVTNILNQDLNGVNPYAVYEECMPNPSAMKNPKTPLYRYTPWYNFKNGINLKTNIVPCALSAGGFAFFNNDTVRQALHVRNSSGYWDSCNDQIYAKYQRVGEGTVNQYQYLRGKGYSILVFSGDTDAVVPTVDTVRWVYGLNWNTIVPYKPWYCDGQIAGYTVQFDSLNLTTVKGAGHMVPQSKRSAAFLLFDSFINGTALPSSI